MNYLLLLFLLQSFLLLKFSSALIRTSAISKNIRDPKSAVETGNNSSPWETKNGEIKSVRDMNVLKNYYAKSHEIFTQFIEDSKKEPKKESKKKSKKESKKESKKGSTEELKELESDFKSVTDKALEHVTQFESILTSLRERPDDANQRGTETEEVKIEPLVENFEAIQRWQTQIPWKTLHHFIKASLVNLYVLVDYHLITHDHLQKFNTSLLAQYSWRCYDFERLHEDVDLLRPIRVNHPEHTEDQWENQWKPPSFAHAWPHIKDLFDPKEFSEEVVNRWAGVPNELMPPQDRDKTWVDRITSTSTLRPISNPSSFDQAYANIKRNK